MRSPGGLVSEVAVKVLRADLGAHSDALRRLHDEARLLASLNHPTILKVVDLVRLDHRIALVTEYIDGADLGDCGVGDDPISARGLVEATGAVADALHTAWNADNPQGRRLELVHRDIKPTNVRIGRHGDTKLLDFGIARSEAIDREARTASDLVVGSLPYMAPERFMDRTPRSESDVFGLGCTLFEALVGERFHGKAAMRSVSGLALDRDRFGQHASERIRKLSRLPPSVQELVASMLAYSPGERPSAREVARACDRIADDLPAPSLKTWARDHVWGEPALAEGPLEGKVLEEQDLGLGGPSTVRLTLPGEVPSLEERAWTDDHESPRTGGVPAQAAPPPPRIVMRKTPRATPSRLEPRATPVDGSTASLRGGVIGALVGLGGGTVVVVLFTGVAAGLAWLVWGPERVDLGPTAAGEVTGAGVDDSHVAGSVDAPAEPPEVDVVRARPQRSVAPAEPPTTTTAPPTSPQPSITSGERSSEAAASPGMARIELDAPGMRVELRHGDQTWPVPGRVPAGFYQLYADTGAGMQRRDQIGVADGAELVVRCDPEPFACRTDTP